MSSSPMFYNLEETVQFLIFGIRKILIETNLDHSQLNLIQYLPWFHSLFVLGVCFDDLMDLEASSPPQPLHNWAMPSLSHQAAWPGHNHPVCRGWAQSSVQGSKSQLLSLAPSYTRIHSFRLRLRPRDNPSSGSGCECHWLSESHWAALALSQWAHTTHSLSLNYLAED